MPNIYGDYLKPNGSAILNRKSNLYNVNDYALKQWDLNQAVKSWRNGTVLYGYGTGGFNRQTQVGADHRAIVQLDIANVLEGGCEAVSFAAQSRSRALGVVDICTAFEGSLDLTLGILATDSDTYLAHKFHSDQYCFNCSDE